ncbi:hypothetical protein CUMW_001250 [Citrus unshiu]|nr:hypothetical protein CUMW_001250 [Citrus unshiu]
MTPRRRTIMTSLLLLLLSLPSISLAYRPGDIVPMSKMSQYHNSRTVWHDVIGKHCAIFAVNREALIPIAKPTGFTGADPVKISFQVGREKFRVPWLFVINRKSSQVPMIDVHLRYSGNDLLGVTAKIVDMPQHYVEIHPDLPKYFWQPESWPKHGRAIRDRRGFWVLCSVCIRAHVVFYSLNLHLGIISGKIYKETVAESSMPGDGVAKKLDMLAEDWENASDVILFNDDHT